MWDEQFSKFHCLWRCQSVAYTGMFFMLTYSEVLKVLSCQLRTKISLKFSIARKEDKKFVVNLVQRLT